MGRKNFEINSALYPHELVDEAIQAFDDFSIFRENDTLTIEDEDPQYVFDEFMNYTLSLIVEA